MRCKPNSAFAMLFVSCPLDPASLATDLWPLLLPKVLHTTTTTATTTTTTTTTTTATTTTTTTFMGDEILANKFQFMTTDIYYMIDRILCSPFSCPATVSVMPCHGKAYAQDSFVPVWLMLVHAQICST